MPRTPGGVANSRHFSPKSLRSLFSQQRPQSAADAHDSWEIEPPLA
jgi:hypothetical protein